ncbi:DNA polymerase I [Peptoniphilus duerdenii]|uniref:DNA polymerase I n=1 Tax=Peptoniphilus duerdenii TaxID=507750 RepID=UPI00288B22BA|nr:DNA polymerase I [Peptoniphilus duerdenii]
MNKILIIDGSSLFFRAFYALPLLKNKKGMYTNAIYGFVMMVENAIDNINPTHVAVCFDKKGRTFRHELYNDYKGTRKKTPSELMQQWPYIMDILKLMNIKTLDSPVYEADDIAGTISKLAAKNDFESYLLTGDKDYFQLVDDKSTVLLTKKGITDLLEVTPKYLYDEYGLTPEEFIDLKALMGDSSDNIPGVPGVGEKTGIKLIKEYKNIENLYQNLDEVSGKKLNENLTENKAQAFMSKKLGTIVTTVPLDYKLDDFKKEEYNFEELYKLYSELDFKTLLARLDTDKVPEIEKVDVTELTKYEVIDLNSMIDKIKKSKIMGFKFITDGKIYEGVDPTYIGLSDGVLTSFYEYSKDIVEDLRALFEDEKIEKIGYDAKEDVIILLSNKIDLKNLTYDSMIVEYLLDSTASSFEFQNIISKYDLGSYKDEESLLGKGVKKKSYSDLEKDELFKYFSFILNGSFKLKETQMEKLEELEMVDLYREIELPLLEVLAYMELTGIKTEVSVLDDIGKNLDDRIENLTSSIFEISGEEFNINSTKQLGEILFDKLRLPVIKKTKTGYSTAQDVLEKLVDESPIIENILEYRKLTKLKNTYIDGLKALINEKTGRIHSRFNQTGTSTGRISSTEPNLQNIPIRSEEGRLIRGAFLASEDSTLVDCDYSQIELRVLASLSKDPRMMEAFEHGMDIHTKTASEVFYVDKEDVTDLLRSRAKAVNFGIVYGISDFGLSRQLGITRELAKEYIDGYFDNFKKVKEYMDYEIETGKKQGYVKTIFNRRRYIPELSAKNFNIRSFGERIALNTPIQGSAADIIKIAMVKVYREIKKRNLKSKLILTIHDELVVDAVNDELEVVEELMKDIMENAVKLNVPLKVSLDTGKSMYETM